MKTRETFSYHRNGPGVFGLLTVLFVGLKLTNYIDWSWWCVLLPLWGPAALFIVAFILFVTFAVLKR